MGATIKLIDDKIRLNLIKKYLKQRGIKAHINKGCLEFDIYNERLNYEYILRLGAVLGRIMSESSEIDLYTFREHEC